MIIYYSATGNTEFIAKEFASALGDDCVNVLDFVKKGIPFEGHSEKPFILCAPVYVCAIPLFLAEFFKKMKLSGNPNLYFVFTSGGYAGMSATIGKHIARKLHLKYRGRAEFRMPRNYVVSNHYPPNTEEEIKERLLQSYQKLDGVIDVIKKGGKLKERHIWLFERIIINPFVPIWSKLKYKTADFYVTEGCIGCKKCENNCPLNVIEIKEGKPIWTKKDCTHCMACIQNCPVRAIEYKGRTERKGRYTFAKYKRIIEEAKRGKE